MKPIQEIQKINDRLSIAQGYDSTVKADLTCTMLRLNEGWLLVDPLPLAEEALAELTADTNPFAILLTNANHERAAADYSKRFGAPIFAHLSAKGKIAVNVERWLEEGEPLFGQIEIMAIDGAAPGEIVLFFNDETGVMVVGDALIHLSNSGFTFLPGKYCEDEKLMQKSLRKLLLFSPEILTFAHGLPIISKASERLVELLES